jgi:hypothetical protein
VADVEPAVQVVGLVEECPRKQILTGLFEGLAFGVLGANGDTLRTRDLLTKPGNAEAALFARLGTFAADDLGIDEHQSLVGVLSGAGVDHRDPLADADLRSRQPHAFRHVHRFEHVLDQFVEFGRIKIRYVFRAGFEHSLPVFDDGVDHQKFFTCSM